MPGSRGTTWTAEDTETLCELWTDIEIPKKFDGCVHNGKVWDVSIICTSGLNHKDQTSGYVGLARFNACSDPIRERIFLVRTLPYMQSHLSKV